MELHHKVACMVGLTALVFLCAMHADADPEIPECSPQEHDPFYGISKVKMPDEVSLTGGPPIKSTLTFHELDPKIISCDENPYNLESKALNVCMRLEKLAVTCTFKPKCIKDRQDILIKYISTVTYNVEQLMRKIVIEFCNKYPLVKQWIFENNSIDSFKDAGFLVTKLSERLYLQLPKGDKYPLKTTIQKLRELLRDPQQIYYDLKKAKPNGKVSRVCNVTGITEIDEDYISVNQKNLVESCGEKLRNGMHMDEKLYENLRTAIKLIMGSFDGNHENKYYLQPPFGQACLNPEE